MKHSPYSDKTKGYFSSLRWQVKRVARLKIDGYRCRFCGYEGSASNPLQVHHTPGSYDLIPNESLENDLTTLCMECHKALHASLTRRRNKWTKSRKSSTR